MNKNLMIALLGIVVAISAAGLYVVFRPDTTKPAENMKKVVVTQKKGKAKKKAPSRNAQKVRAQKINQSLGADKPDMSLTLDEEANLSAEMKDILAQLQDALDDNDAQKVSKLAERILVTQRKKGQDAVPPYVREKAVEAIGFFLPGSLADLVGFMADSDPDVLQDVMDKFAEAIDDPDLGDRELSSILTSVAKVLNNEDAVEALFFAIESDMRHSVAVQTYLNVWENGSKEVQAKVLESISDFTGEDDITTPEQLKKWLEENPDDEDDEDFYAGASATDDDD